MEDVANAWTVKGMERALHVWDRVVVLFLEVWRYTTIELTSRC